MACLATTCALRSLLATARWDTPRVRRFSMVMSHATVALDDPEDTMALGAHIAEASAAGCVVLLDGDYGAGKTCLARGFVQRWLSDPDEAVTSPSYLIDNVYDDIDGRALCPGVTVHHMDLWRLPEGKAAQLIDFSHVFSECVSLIEWPEKLGAGLMPEQRLEVRLTHAADPLEDDECGRVARLVPVGETWVRQLGPLLASLREDGFIVSVEESPGP